MASIANAVLSSFSNALTTLSTNLATELSKLVNTTGAALQTVLTNIGNLVQQILKNLDSSRNLLLTQAAQLAANIIAQGKNASQALFDALTDILSKLVNITLASKAKVDDAISKILAAKAQLSWGVINAAANLVTKAKADIDALINHLLSQLATSAKPSAALLQKLQDAINKLVAVFKTQAAQLKARIKAAGSVTADLKADVLSLIKEIDVRISAAKSFIAGAGVNASVKAIVQAYIGSLTAVKVDLQASIGITVGGGR